MRLCGTDTARSRKTLQISYNSGVFSNSFFMVTLCNDMTCADGDTIKKRFASEAFYADICSGNSEDRLRSAKRNKLPPCARLHGLCSRNSKTKGNMKFFNTIPGDGEVAILLYGDVGDGQKVESGRVVSELLELQARYRKIDVRINSKGGDVFSGIAIYNALKTSKADITIYVDGVAASIAGVIALCGKPLYMSPYAKLMLHSVSGGTWGNASALRRMAGVMEALQEDLARMIAARCGMEAEAVAARYFDEQDHWISAEEAVGMKLADGIYDMTAEDGNAPSSAEEAYQYFNNRLQERPQNDKEMGLIDQMKKMPSFKDANDEQDIIDMVRELENRATKADALERANKAYKEKMDAAEAKEVEAVLDKAVADGRISKEQLPTFKALMASDRANTEALLAGMKPSRQMRAAAYIDDTGNGGGMADKSWDELDKAGLLSELKAADKALFVAKYKEKFGVDYKE